MLIEELVTESEVRAMKARLLSPDGSVDADDGESDTKLSRAVRMMKRITGAAAIGALAYTALVRPWHLRWGATGEEAASALPGDELLEEARMQTTRAITIDAPASRIWPWLVQMGQGRGGLYSYDWLENLAGCDIHSADRIIPELQSLNVGDAFRLGPEGYPAFTVASIRPERELVLAAGLELHDGAAPSPLPAAARQLPAATWAFVLKPLDEHHTRLLIRLRGNWEPSMEFSAFNRLLLEPAHFIMERRMIQGIKERAEGTASET